MQRNYATETIQKIGQQVLLKGWVNVRRDHGKLIFLDLRDKSGIVQLVVNPKVSEEAHKAASEVRNEYVLEISGLVKNRDPKLVNPSLPTGKIEIEVSTLEILNKAKPLPISVDTDGYEISEDIRLKYRYLDLRRPRLQRNLRIRHKAAQFVRKFLSDLGFVEIETPYITKGTPEGAREFLIPSRLHPGKFYTLPQSPQQFKQLLMVAGIERYFQLARIFRDEDSRADRSYGEATQIDIEMSFVAQNDILEMVEQMFVELVKAVLPEKHVQQTPFPRIRYEEAIKQYGSDKPDLRKNKKDPNELAFCFIIDWPLFEWNEAEKHWDPHHHIFTSPKESDIPLLDKDPSKARSWQHDLVLNGYEIGGGSIRITDPKVQKKIFNLVGIPMEEGKSKFAHMLEAFEYGVPPHGGIAIGFDRMFIPLLGEPNLREVMAFPKTGDGRDLMMDAPSTAEEKQLKELHLKVDLPPARRSLGEGEKDKK